LLPVGSPESNKSEGIRYSAGTKKFIDHTGASFRDQVWNTWGTESPEKKISYL